MEFEPYKIKKPEESDYLIAYIDLLGTKEYVEKGDDNVIFDYIYEAYTLATKGFVEDKVWGFDDIKYKIFSDNLLVAIKAEKENLPEAYNTIYCYLVMLLLMLITKGVLFRGGMTYGKLAIDDTIVWGKGLIEVVQIEEKIAIYPRIVLSDSLVNTLKSFLKENMSFEDEYSCFTDFDGCVYFDYIFYSKESTDKIYESSNEFIDKKLIDEKNPRIIQKYLWHKNFLKLSKEKFDSMLQENSFDKH